MLVMSLTMLTLRDIMMMIVMKMMMGMMMMRDDGDYGDIEGEVSLPSYQPRQYIHMIYVSFQ